MRHLSQYGIVKRLSYYFGGHKMIFEVTTQVRVSNIEEGQKWYEILLNRKPDVIPHWGIC
ncbi:lysine/ornithine N-monooxygenase [Paenibacillus sp. TCA20]|nr:lysine/ornithine N-monooxygenase [Paenibacillus sp. TCA20]